MENPPNLPPQSQLTPEPNNQLPPDQDGAGSWLARNGVLLLLLAALAVFLLRRFDLEQLFGIAMAAVGLGLLVFVHELGHFLVAKACDVHVETFSIGFGPALPGCKFQWGETTYMIAAFPLGGYVKMVGEGPESDEDEDDPRSFRHKPVWQRMAIISAGVIMNLLLAFACFVYVFRTHGAERIPGIVDHVEAGSPAWKLGVRTGDVIHWIGSKGPNPSFDDLKPVVMNSRENEQLYFEWGPPNAAAAQIHHAHIEPSRSEDEGRPVIGISPPNELTLIPQKAGRRQNRSEPVLYESAAARAEPAFEFGDTIEATSVPDDAAGVRALPEDPDNPGHRNYFDFERRQRELAGKPMLVQVRRQATGDLTTLNVPAASYWVLGARMRMGKVTAVRDGSPAATSGIQAEDIIDRVEVADRNGGIIRYVSTPGKAPGRGVTEKDLDPVRLPFDLEQWAGSQPQGAKRTVTMIVLRTNPQTHVEREPKILKLDWDPSWRFNNEVPIGIGSALSVPELGIAYRVETRIEAVTPQSPAAQARVEQPIAVKFKKGDLIRRGSDRITAAEGEVVPLQTGDLINLRADDVIKACRFDLPGKSSGAPGEPGRWLDLGADQWVRAFFRLQLEDLKQIGLRVERDNVTLETTVTPVVDPSWARADRGLWLEADTRLHQAATLGEALLMGWNDTLSFIGQIYQNLEGLVRLRVSPKNFGGPIMIAQLAYFFALDDIYHFLRFLGIISINLAVINFLPIPVLDGGHMVFLIYEKLRGKPVPRRVQEAATYVGLAFILCLMILVIYIDLRRS